MFSSYAWIVDCVSAKSCVPQMTAQHAKPNDSSKEPYCQYVIMRSIQMIFESITYHSLIYVIYYHESLAFLLCRYTIAWAYFHDSKSNLAESCHHVSSFSLLSHSHVTFLLLPY